MEQQIRAKRREVQQKRLEVKQAAETLADAFDQKRKLKRAAKKIMLAAQGPDMGSRDGSPLLSDTASPPRLEKDELETHPQEMIESQMEMKTPTRGIEESMLETARSRDEIEIGLVGARERS